MTEDRLVSQLDLLSVGLALRYYSTTPLIDVNDLLWFLTKRGFTTIPASQRRDSGDVYAIAEKGTDIIISFVPDMGVIRVSGIEVDGVITSFKEVLGVISKDLRIKLESYAKFTEVTLRYDYYSSKNVLKLFQNIFQDSKYMMKFEKILGQPIWNFTIRLASKAPTFNQENWFDIVIEPKIASDGNAYFIQAVMRDRDLDKVMAFTNEIPKKIGYIVNEIELAGKD